MARLPIPGGDQGTWGDILNEFLSVSHDSDGTIKAAAISSKADASDLTSHTSNTSNPHSVTKAQVGLSNVDNTSDANKPVSTPQQTALDLKADDSAVVHDTGDETIAGIKTFSSSPIVPTPTTSTQAAHKGYVDTEITDLPELADGVGTTVDDSVSGFVSLDITASDIQEFTSNGTWTKPAGAKTVLALLIGGGGGGASGSRDAEGVFRSGGGGGAPGARVVAWLDATELDDTEAVTIGTGGAGGAALTSTTGVGNDGVAGGDTILDTIASDVNAKGGSPGTHLFGFLPGNAGEGPTGRGGYALQDSTTRPPDRLAATGFNGGGGAGASRLASNALTPAGNGGGTMAGSGGAASNPGAAGAAGAHGYPGSGGGGGSTLISTGNQPGGAGGFPGGGGGGGSFGNTGAPNTSSGPGGAGADGYALIISFL